MGWEFTKIQKEGQRSDKAEEHQKVVEKEEEEEEEEEGAGRVSRSNTRENL